MEAFLRSIAREHLSDRVRKPIGWFAGQVQARCILPMLGMIFDLKGARFRAGGCTFRIPRDITTRAFRSCFLQRAYEQYEIELIPRYIRPDDRVLELGACMGIVSCITNKLLKDRTSHVVVEANPFCVPVMHRNREQNQCGFLIEHCAVDLKPEVTFYLHPQFIVGGNSQRPTDRPVRLPAKSLRQLESERGPFSALIIDIEGSEREVFESSADVLKKYRVVIVELHDWAIGKDGVERCRQILRDSGMVFVEGAGIVEVWRRDS